MDITPYLDQMAANFASSAGTGGAPLVEAAQRLSTAFDAAVHLTLLEVLGDAAAEISAALPGGSVELRLKGRDPQFVVTAPSLAEPQPSATFEGPAEGDTATARLTLRLPDALKQRIDDAAGRAGLSTNTWLVETIRTALSAPSGNRRGRGRQLSGWAR